MKVLYVLLLTFVASAETDMWRFFHPESVTEFGCTIQIKDIITRGGSPVTQWTAEAHAKRKDYQDWSIEIGRFEPTEKGFKSAMRECEKWQIEASRIVKKAQHESH